MSCTKNIKKFLIWKWEGDHDYKINKFGRFVNGRTNSYFVAQFECKNCGAQHTRHFVSENELLRNGITIEQIANQRDKVFT